MYGTQTGVCGCGGCAKFENDVEMYGTQTPVDGTSFAPAFENDVEMYGTQTPESVKASVYNHYFE